MAGRDTPAQLAEHVERYGSFAAAIEEAKKRPGYAELIDRTQSYVWAINSGLPFAGGREPVPPRWSVEELVVAALADKQSLNGDRDDVVGGEGYSRNECVAAGKLYAKGKMTVRAIEAYADLKQTRAYRVYRQLQNGAVVYDVTLEQVRPGPGYRWDPLELQTDPPRYRLIRA